jgi:hypothetical protein
LKQRAAQQLDIYSRVVLVILDAVQFEQGESYLVIYQLPVGSVLETERGDRSLAVEALAPLCVGALLFLHASRAYVIEQRIECDGLAGLRVEVLVVAGLRGVRGRKCEAIVNELFTKRGELGVGCAR